MIGIIDYGMGNLRSVENALDHLGLDHVISSDSQVLDQCDRLILPGVGAMQDCMKALKEAGLDTWLRAQTRPLLGICLGMQAFFEDSAENGGVQCLGLMPGHFEKMEDPAIRVPHIGWNELEVAPDHPLKDILGDHPYVYYDHSYYGCDLDPDTILGVSHHGKYTIPGLTGKGSLLACQFHPEKSGETGLKILSYFGKEMQS